MRTISATVVFLSVLTAVCMAQTPAPAAPPPKAAAGAPAAGQAAADPVVLQVGEEKLTRSAFEAVLAALPEQVRAQAAGAGKRRLAEQLIDIKVLAQEAQRRKLDQDPVFKQKVALQVEQMLASAVYEQVLQNSALSDAMLRQYYDQHKSDYERVKARHILIRMQGSPVALREGQKDRTEQEALAVVQELRRRIESGGDFAALARENSDDPGTRAAGGEMGTFTRGQMVPEFDKVAFSLTPGQLSQPFKTQFGYHILQVQERTTRTFEEVKGEISQREQARRAGEAVAAMKKASTVYVDESYFGVIPSR